MKRILIPTGYNEAILIDQKDTIQMFHILSRARNVRTESFGETVTIQPSKKMEITLIDQLNIVESKPEAEDIEFETAPPFRAEPEETDKLSPPPAPDDTESLL